MKPARLTMFWPTDPRRPQLAVGHFMKTERGRVAYEITAIRPVQNRGRLVRFGTKLWALTCTRWEPKEVPVGVTLHAFVWNRR